MCVLEKVGADRPLMIGYLSTGAVNVMAAATRPDLARALVWLEPMARYAWAPTTPGAAGGRSWTRSSRTRLLGHRRVWYAGSSRRSLAGNVMPESMAMPCVKQARSAARLTLPMSCRRSGTRRMFGVSSRAFRFRPCSWSTRCGIRCEQAATSRASCRRPRSGDARDVLDDRRAARVARRDPTFLGRTFPRPARHGVGHGGVHRHRRLHREAGGARRPSVEGAGARAPRAWSAMGCRAGTASRTTRRATASSPPSTDRHERSDARPRSSIVSGISASRSAPASTRANAS